MRGVGFDRFEKKESNSHSQAQLWYPALSPPSPGLSSPQGTPRPVVEKLWSSLKMIGLNLKRKSRHRQH